MQGVFVFRTWGLNGFGFARERFDSRCVLDCLLGVPTGTTALGLPSPPTTILILLWPTERFSITIGFRTIIS